MNFMRYIGLLDPSDPRKVEGQKLIERIFLLEKYKAIKNQSLQIFEYESQILEEGLDEGSQKTHINTMAPHQKVFVRDMDINILHSLQKDGLQSGIIGFLKEYKLTDIMFLRGSPTEFLDTYRIDEDGFSLVHSTIPWSSLNILQIAVASGHIDLVKYILFEHRIFSNTRQTRTMDPRIILLNHDNEDDESLTLRLAIQSGNVELFKILWDYYPQLYTDKHLLAVARAAIYMRRHDFYLPIIASPTSTPIFLSSPIAHRVAFVDLFDDRALGFAPEKSTIIQLLGQEPYTRLDKQVSDDRLLSIYNYIRLNEVDHLREIVSAGGIQGVAHLLFDFFEDDEEVFPLADGSRITVSFLNPILFAIRCKSFDCLTYLVQTFGVRQSMRQHTLTTRIATRDLTFKHLIFPLILKAKDNDILAFLLKQEGFFFTSYDFSSFVVQALYERWHQGLRTFLWSNAAQFYFSSLSWESQRAIVDRIVRTVVELDEQKLRHHYVSNILEETLTKRPYAKHLTALLLQRDLMTTVDGSKLTRECLKNLTSEDLMQLSHMEGVSMVEYERAYPNVQGSAYENELAKIMLRYNNEGKPSLYNANRKQVTFDERDRSYDNQL